MKVLVVIANYGTKNDAYLTRVLSEYRQMRHDVDLMVLSNLDKDLGPDVEMVVGVPYKDHWAMPFAHKRIFAERQDAYDLFIYTEDDMLITERNIDAFLRVSRVLSESELVGFFQWEQYPDGRRYYPAVHNHFHWVAGSHKVVGDHTFGRFTNQHSACYLLTQVQLKRAIASKGFLVDPHDEQYDLLVTAATDPYTQCGFTKLLCLSHFEEFLVAHLPNRYIGSTMGLDCSEFSPQLQFVLCSGHNRKLQKQLLEPETKLFRRRWSKDYYEPRRDDLIELVPSTARSVLSIGCGWGATEEALKQSGLRVVAIPLDGVIAACAESRGIEMEYGDLQTAVGRLSGQEFDLVLMSGILHLFPDPETALLQASSLLSKNGTLIATVPNFGRLPVLWERLRYPARYKGLRDHDRSGLHAIGRRQVSRWFRNTNLKIQSIVERVPESWIRIAKMLGGAADHMISREYIMVGRKETANAGRAGVLTTARGR